MSAQVAAAAPAHWAGARHMTHVAVGAIYLGIVCQQALLSHQIDERAFQKKSRVVPAGGGLEADRKKPPA